MSRQTRASVNTCIVLVVSSAGSEWSILDAVARGDGVSAAALSTLQRCEQGVTRASDAISGVQQCSAVQRS